MAIKQKKQRNGAIRSVVYVRYSDHKQDGSFSIEYQISECERYITIKGYSLVKQYIDKAKSGKKVAGREEFEQMCRDAARDKFDTIVVFSLSRSFRNVREALNFCHEMYEKHNIHIESVIEPIDLTSPHGKFSGTNLFAMHELQSDITAAHVKAGMHIAAQQGYHLGGYCPFGYELYGTGEFSRGKERQKYKPHPEERKIVNQLFQWYADGFSLTFLQEEMKKRRIFGRKGNILGQQTIGRILRNEFYIGTRVFDIDGYETLILPNNVPAIIEMDLWNKVQARHIAQKEVAPRKREKRLYELTGKIHCEKCGSHFFGFFANDKRNPNWAKAWYTCAKKKSQRDCTAKNLRKDRLDKYVMQQIRLNILNDEAMERIAEEIANIAEDSPISTKEEISKLEKEKANLVRMESELTLKELKGEISKETYSLLKKDFTEQIAEINLKLVQLGMSEENEISKESVLEYLRDMFDNIETAEPEILKNIFDKVVEKIVVSDDEVQLHLVVSPLSLPHSDSKTSQGHPHYKLLTEITRTDLNNHF